MSGGGSPPVETGAGPPARHMQVAQAEQAALRARGQNLSINDVLRRNGLLHERRDPTSSAAINNMQRHDLSMQALRLYVPSSLQAAMGICLLGLRDGVLRIAVGDTLSDNEQQKIMSALRQANRPVERVELEPYDRAALQRLMRDQTENASERLVRLFASLARDPDNALNIEQAVSDIFAEALQMRCSDIHMTFLEDDARCWIRYRVDGDLVYKHLLPASVMAPIVTRIKTDSKMDAAERQRPQDGRLRWDPLESTCRHASLSIL